MLSPDKPTRCPNARATLRRAVSRFMLRVVWDGFAVDLGWIWGWG